MAGIETVEVRWAPLLPPLSPVIEPEDWVVLPEWQSIKVSGGQTIEDVTQVFNVGTAKVRLRNGDQTGRAPTFVPETSYKGRNIQIREPDVIGSIFDGRIDRVEFHYDQTPWAAFVTLHCVDTIGAISDVAVPDELSPGQPPVDYFTQALPVDEMIVEILAEVSTILLDVSTEGELSHQYVKAPDAFETRQGLLDFLNEVLLTEGAALYALPDSNALFLRGRWNMLRLLSATPPITDVPITLTDALTYDTDNSEFPYRRDDLEWADADAEYANAVQTRSKYLDVTYTEENVETGYPKQQLSRTELVTIRQGWVEANARMWFKLFNQRYAYPKKVKFMVATRGQIHPNCFSQGAINVLAQRQFQVLHTPPGSTQRTYRVVPDSVDHDIDRQRWLCALGFTSLDRWWNAYSNGTDPIEMIEISGDADHGIGSEAIIAP